MGKLIKDHVAWVLTFLGILATLTSAAVMEIRNDQERISERLTALEVYVYGKAQINRPGFNSGKFTGVDETQAR